MATREHKSEPKVAQLKSRSARRAHNTYKQGWFHETQLQSLDCTTSRIEGTYVWNSEATHIYNRSRVCSEWKLLYPAVVHGAVRNPRQTTNGGFLSDSREVCIDIYSGRSRSTRAPNFSLNHGEIGFWSYHTQECRTSRALPVVTFTYVVL